MEEYYVEMSFGFGVTTKVKAESEADAIKKAKESIPKRVSIDSNTFDDDDVNILNCGDIEYEQVNFVDRIVVDNN